MLAILIALAAKMGLEVDSAVPSLLRVIPPPKPITLKEILSLLVYGGLIVMALILLGAIIIRKFRSLKNFKSVKPYTESFEKCK